MGERSREPLPSPVPGVQGGRPKAMVFDRRLYFVRTSQRACCAIWPGSAITRLRRPQLDSAWSQQVPTQPTGMAVRRELPVRWGLLRARHGICDSPGGARAAKARE